MAKTKFYFVACDAKDSVDCQTKNSQGATTRAANAWLKAHPTGTAQVIETDGDREHEVVKVLYGPNY